MGLHSKVVSSYSLIELLNEKQVADILGLKVGTLRRWRWSGRGPTFIKIGDAVRYHPDKLTDFIEAGERRSTSDDSGEAPPPPLAASPRR